MTRISRSRLFIAVPLTAVLLATLTVLLLARSQDIKSRSALIVVGMPRGQVEQSLGLPVLVLQRSAGRGAALSWTDQFWQVDVLTGPDGRVESIGCIPSDSLYGRTVGRLLGKGHTHPHQAEILVDGKWELPRPPAR